jgi:hypothetical protein
LKDVVTSNIGVYEGETIVDFGESFGELPIMELTPKNGNGYFFVNTIEEKNHVQKYLRKKSIHNIVPLLLGKDDLPSAHVAFYDFFYHSLSPKEDIEKMVGCLKSGGRLIIIDMFYAPQVASLNDFFQFRFPRREHVLDEESVRILLKEAGLKDIELNDLGTLCIIKGVKPYPTVLRTSVTSTPETLGRFLKASSSGVVSPPSLSVVRMMRFNATRPNAIGSSSILWRAMVAGIVISISLFRASLSTSGDSGSTRIVATTLYIQGPSNPHVHLYEFTSTLHFSHRMMMLPHRGQGNFTTLSLGWISL